MNRYILKTKRSIQSSCPYLDPALQYLAIQYTKRLGIPHEKEFGALKYFPYVKDALYIDVGANHGQSIESIRVFRPENTIISFEPNPLLAQRLQKSYSSELNVQIKNFGLGSKPGVFSLFVPSYKGFLFDSLASFKEEAARDYLNKERLFGFKERYLKIHEVKGEVKTLDMLDIAPFFVKIDVQDLECEVILGGIETIRAHLPILLVENVRATGPIMDYLKPFRYDIYRYENGTFLRGVRGAPNSFLIPDEKAELIKQAIEPDLSR